MHIHPAFRRGCLIALMFAGSSSIAQAQTAAVSPGTLRTYSTIYSLGVEWNLTNDTDHDATAAVEYRISGTTAWRRALPLVRIDFNGSNMLAGSVLFLAPDTSYDLRLSLVDPDGGGETRVISQRTRPVPRAPVTGRIFHVMPGAGGGTGSPEAPFGGIAAAESVAQPGDTFLLHAGAYGGRIRFTRGGAATSYVAWRAAGDGEVLMNGIDVLAGYVWLQGVTVRNQRYAVLSFNSPAGVVITRSTFENNHYGIYLQGAGSNWYIADNTIRGDTPASSESLDGEGIDLNTTSGHTVAHNRIFNVADGISYPYINVDIFGNDIFDASDDGIEADNGRANVRIWGNRIHNAVHNGISFQPQAGGPWYIVRNQIAGNKEGAFKFRTTDRFVLLHNTIVNWGNAWPGTSMLCCNEDHLLRAYARNNLWVSVQGGQIWGLDAGTPDWRTDLDYDGFDWGSAANPFEYGGVTYGTLLGFSNASGLEANGVRIWKNTCFEQFNVPGPAPTPVPPQVMTLQAGCPAVDGGATVDAINDDFAGTAPDLGAHELGAPPTHYGPRAALQPPLAPGALAASAVSSTRVDLRWADQSNNESGFRIERSAGGQPFASLATVGPNAVTFSDLTVTAGAQYAYRVAAYNAAGLSAYSNVASVTTQSGLAPEDVALYAGEAPVRQGAWAVTADGTAAGGVRLYNRDAGLAKVTTPAANPVDYFEMTFNAQAGRAYRLWIRGKALNNAYPNDSAWVQFSDSVNASNAAAWRIGSTSGIALSVEECSGCGLSAWGWHDSGWGVGVRGAPVYFATSGTHRIRVQRREDGISIDQIVLSPATFFTSAPGTTKNDTTILPRSAGTAGSGSAPPAVTGLSATGTSPTQISLAWTDVAGETQYLLERSTSSSTGFVQIATIGANVTRYADSGRAIGTTYYYRIRAGNANGYSPYSAVASARTQSGLAPEDVALYAGEAPVRQGAWAVTADGTAAGGVRLYNRDAGLAKVTTPAANPVDYFEMTFNAQAGRAYRLWIRGKALNNAYPNDSAWVQFSDSVNASNAAAWRIGSTSGIALSVEECSGCGLSAWGWHDSGWGVGVRGAPVYFATSGTHRIRVQRREDGISIDQIVLSPATFFTSAPGAPKNDTTILPRSAGTP